MLPSTRPINCVRFRFRLNTRIPYANDKTMTAYTDLQHDIEAEIAAASDLAALDAVRVSALGKTGRISGLRCPARSRVTGSGSSCSTGCATSSGSAAP